MQQQQQQQQQRITCHLMGGLGNQLFQIFTTIATAIKYKRKFIFSPDYDLLSGKSTARHTYWDTMLTSLKICLSDEDISSFDIIRELSFAYSPININVNNKNNNIQLYGYFQSYKYFNTYKDTICRLLKFNENNTNQTNNISMHFRIGDYKTLQHIHPIMPYAYYENAIAYILTKRNIVSMEANIMFFCEYGDLNEVMDTYIIPLSKQYTNITFINGSFINEEEEEAEDWQQMLTMSYCRDNIIANSTFSWWSAYLNNSPNKIICYPSQWFGSSVGTVGTDTRDLFPPDWIRIETLSILTKSSSLSQTFI